MLRGALRSALATKFQEHKLTVVDQFNFSEAKTKGFIGALGKLGLENGILVVDDAANRNLTLSSRNVKGCDTVRRHELHPYHVLSHDQLVISEGALTRLQEALR
jgi:large subunit ribosomal protein L4